MIVALAAAIAVLALAYVAYPLLRADTEEPTWLLEADSTATARLADLVARQQATYAALRELTSDYQTGALDEATYTRQRARYERRALALLKALDAWEAAADVTLAERIPALHQLSQRSADDGQARTSAPMAKA